VKLAGRLSERAAADRGHEPAAVRRGTLEAQAKPGERTAPGGVPTQRPVRICPVPERPRAAIRSSLSGRSPSVRTEAHHLHDTAGAPLQTLVVNKNRGLSRMRIEPGNGILFNSR
jgi:hypothetical protein